MFSCICKSNNRFIFQDTGFVLLGNGSCDLQSTDRGTHSEHYTLIWVIKIEPTMHVHYAKTLAVALKRKAKLGLSKGMSLPEI